MSLSLKSSIYNTEIKIGEKELVFNLSSGACIELGIERMEEISLLSEEELQILIQEGFIIDSDVNEVEMIKAFWTGSRYESTSPTVMIAPTMACNFECVYCYAPHKPYYMNEEVAGQVIEFIKSLTKHSQSVRLVWVGGEPLLAVNTILLIKKELNKCLDIKVNSDIVTNGVLLNRKTVKDLLSVGIKNAIVSIDGSERLHNARRKWKEKGNSYEVILENIKNAINEGMNIIVRINIDHNNIHELDELIADLHNKDLIKNVTISIVPTQVFNDRCLTVVDHCISSGVDMKRLLEIAQQIPNSTWGGPDPKLSVCNALCSKDFTIGSYGELYKCPVEIGEKDKVVGHVSGGLIKNSLIKWMNYQPPLKEECLECECVPLCISKCPRQFLNTSNTELQCEATKTYYKDLIKFTLKTSNYI